MLGRRRDIARPNPTVAPEAYGLRRRLRKTPPRIPVIEASGTSETTTPPVAWPGGTSGRHGRGAGSIVLLSPGGPATSSGHGGIAFSVAGSATVAVGVGVGPVVGVDVGSGVGCEVGRAIGAAVATGVAGGACVGVGVRTGVAVGFGRDVGRGVAPGPPGPTFPGAAAPPSGVVVGSAAVVPSPDGAVGGDALAGTRVGMAVGAVEGTNGEAAACVEPGAAVPGLRAAVSADGPGELPLGVVHPPSPPTAIVAVTRTRFSTPSARIRRTRWTDDTAIGLSFRGHSRTANSDVLGPILPERTTPDRGSAQLSPLTEHARQPENRTSRRAS